MSSSSFESYRGPIAWVEEPGAPIGGYSEDAVCFSERFARFGTFGVFTRRIRSFENTPLREKAETLARAGFFHTGYDDVVVCYHCGLIAPRDINADNPFDQHAELNPTCDFITRGRGYMDQLFPPATWKRDRELTIRKRMDKNRCALGRIARTTTTPTTKRSCYWLNRGELIDLTAFCFGLSIPLTVYYLSLRYGLIKRHRLSKDVSFLALALRSLSRGDSDDSGGDVDADAVRD